MLVYCKWCQCLVKRVDNSLHRENTVLVLICPRCKKELNVIVRYRPKCIDRIDKEREGAKISSN